MSVQDFAQFVYKQARYVGLKANKGQSTIGGDEGVDHFLDQTIKHYERAADDRAKRVVQDLLEEIEEEYDGQLTVDDVEELKEKYG